MNEGGGNKRDAQMLVWWSRESTSSCALDTFTASATRKTILTRKSRRREEVGEEGENEEEEEEEDLGSINQAIPTVTLCITISSHISTLAISSSRHCPPWRSARSCSQQYLSTAKLGREGRF